MDAIYVIQLSSPSGYVAWSKGVSSYLMIANLGLSIGTNAITTAIIAYKLWYVTLGALYLIQLLIMKHNARTHRMTIVKNLGLRGWRGPVQNILILLVESGLFYLVLQVRLPNLTH